jgi:hypothetical protein
MIWRIAMSAEGWVMVIAAIGVVAVNVITAWRSSTKQDAANTKQDVAERKLDVIHDLTNNTLTEFKNELKQALARIKTLEGFLEESKERERGHGAAEKHP